MKPKISMGLAKMSVPQKIVRGRHIVSSMTNNSSFTAPSPSLASVTTAIDDLEAAYNAAQGGGPAHTSAMYDKESMLNTLLTQLGNYVENAANGSEAVILGAGMGVKAKGGSHPFVFKVENGEHEGEAVLHSPVTPRTGYVWEVSVDPLPADAPAPANNNTWKQAGVTTKATLVIKGLTQGMKYWFRVAGVSKSGQGLWSDPISLIAQ